jgi:ribosomal protein L11 methyltransferase
MPATDKWIEITILTASEAVEAVSAILYDAGVGGVAIEDPKDVINSNTQPHDWDYIEEKLLPEDTGEVKVKGYLLDNEGVSTKIDIIRQSVEKLDEYGLDKGKGEVTVKDVSEQDWANAWKQYYKPFKIGEHIVIKPTWEEYEPETDDIVIELDPGMAFGTGTHETTRLCIELLEHYVDNNAMVLDIGCGSGILSITASKLGAAKVIGVDIDEVAVRSSKENILTSKVENVEIRQGNLFDVVNEKADIIVANIIADVIIGVCDILPQFIKQDGIFISSGIIRDRADDVKKALLLKNFRILQVREMGEWVAIAAKVKE